MAPGRQNVGVPAPLIGRLRFLYTGVDDTETAVAYYLDALGGTLRWRFQHFGADVAAIDLPGDRDDSPLVMLADHRPAGTVLPIYEVEDLDAVTRHFVAEGVRVDGPMGSPEGDAIVVHGPDGGELAFLEVVRPGAMDGAYADRQNEHRVL